MTELNDQQIDIIAEKAARKALQIVYAEVGQNVLRKLAWLIGVGVVTALMFFAGKPLK